MRKIFSHGILFPTQNYTLNSVVAGRCEPIGQDREGFLEGPADSAPHQDVFTPVIVGQTQPPSVTGDRVVIANWTSSGQEFQRDHPGSMLSFDSGSVIKRITAGVKARR